MKSKYQSLSTIQQMTTPQLLAYRKELRNNTNLIRKEIDELGNSWSSLKDELKQRLNDNRTKIEALELKRLRAYNDIDFIELELQ